MSAFVTSSFYDGGYLSSVDLDSLGDALGVARTEFSSQGRVEWRISVPDEHDWLFMLAARWGRSMRLSEAQRLVAASAHAASFVSLMRLLHSDELVNAALALLGQLEDVPTPRHDGPEPIQETEHHVADPA